MGISDKKTKNIINKSFSMGYNDSDIDIIKYYNDNNDNNNHNNNNRRKESAVSSKYNTEIIQYSKKEMSRQTNLNEIVSSVNNDEINEYIAEGLKSAHSYFIEACIVYLFYIIFIISITIYEKEIDKAMLENEKYIQNNNKKWSYKCCLENIDLILNLIDLLLFIYIDLKGKSIMENECIFKITKYIIISSYIAITLGPTINVILNYIILIIVYIIIF